MNPVNIKAQSKPKWMSDPQMAMLGRIAMMEDQMAALVCQMKELKEQIEEFMRRLALTNNAQPVQDRDRLLTEEEARQMIGVSYQTMWRWRKARLIEHVLLPGGDIRYTRESIQAFIAGHIKTVRPLRALRKLA